MIKSPCPCSCAASPGLPCQAGANVQINTHLVLALKRHNYFANPGNENITMAIQILSHDTNLANKELLQKLIECALTCEACEAACLNEENITLLARCIELNRDCADICLHASRLVQRDSEIAEEYMTVCEKICRMCAEECNKHNLDYCKTCAETCLACADACHELAAG
jgi:hypothetical protein